MLSKTGWQLRFLMTAGEFPWAGISVSCHLKFRVPEDSKPMGAEVLGHAEIATLSMRLVCKIQTAGALLLHSSSARFFPAANTSPKMTS